MKNFLQILLALLAAAMVVGAESQPTALWYTQPALKWTDAVPIGNGRMGAMVFGGISDERIQFNEDTLWKGQPRDYVRTNAGDYLAEIRNFIAAGDITNATRLARSKFLSDPVRQKPYQPFGDLRLHFDGMDNATGYRRELDLDTAIATTMFTVDGVTYQREAFASYPDRAIIVRLTANKPGRINFRLRMDSRQANSQTRVYMPDTLAMAGQVETNGLKFESRVRVVNEGGTLETNLDALVVSQANAVTLLLVAETSFKNFQDISAHPGARCTIDMDDVSKHKYSEILATHLADYQKLFGRVSLDLGHTASADQPTDVRLQELKTAGLSNDPALAALHFQYGRYLLIASSRPGSQPANLQGVWNDEIDPPWESKWTLNINCEMNYWPAELCNLSECHEPLFDMIDDLVISGSRTAKEQYNSRGWVAHHNTDLWRGTAPINNIDGIWPTGGAWLCFHLWEHYLFTGDKTFLARAYPDMKQASLFFVDSLVKEPKHGWLVTSPSFSPEEGTLCMGPTMDNQIIRELMDATIRSAAILNTDQEFAAQLADVRSKLAPNQIGKHGQLQEWLEDMDVPNNNHRHMSPLFAVYPGDGITPARSNLFAAAKVLLKWRGDGSTGWSYAWRMPLWARAGDGDVAFHQFEGLLQKRTLPNLFDLCGPFQIDGNFGACAGVAEMLVQSQQTDALGVRIIELIPALPKAWPTGSVKGLCARGGFEVDIAWENGVLKQAVVRSKLGQPCVVRCGDHEIQLKTQPGGSTTLDAQLHQAITNK